MHHERMSERVRNVGDGIILAFPVDEATPGGEEIATVRLYFFRVGSATRYYQKYTSLSDIATGNTSPTTSYDYLGDTGVGSGSDVFRVESDDWHLLHFGVGTEHPDLEVFHTVSPKANGDPAVDRRGSNEDITPGTDDRGFYSSKQIEDRYDPPAFTERVSFRNDIDGEFLLWAFHNDGGQTLSGGDLDLHFTGGGYKVQPVESRSEQDIMLEMALSRPADPDVDTVLHQVGGVTPYNLGSEEPDSWGDVEFTRTMDISVAPVASAR